MRSQFVTVFAVLCILVLMSGEMDAKRKHNRGNKRNKKNHRPGHVDSTPNSATVDTSKPATSDPSSSRTRREINETPKNENQVSSGGSLDEKLNSFVEDLVLATQSSNPADETEEVEDKDFSYDDYKEVEYEDEGESDLNLASTFWSSYYPAGGYRRYLRRRGWWPAGYAHNRWY